MIALICAAAAAIVCAALARKLCGDAFAATVAAAIYALAPGTRILIGADPRWALGLVLLPLLLLLFYRASQAEEEDRPGRSAPALCLAVLGALDPRLATAFGLLIWILLLSGYARDRRRARAVWGPAFSRWALNCLGGILLYAPLWWWRLRHRPLLLVYAAPPIDFLDLWRPSFHYLGAAACLLALAGPTLSRSYRAQARLWSIVAAVMIWLSLGPYISWSGRTLAWAPSLYRLARLLPWIGRVPPVLFAGAGQLALGMLSAFGFCALIARIPPSKARLARILGLTLALGILAADYVRL